MNHIDVFVFSSSTLTNIWAGVGAQLWAVSAQQKRKVGGAKRKAQALHIGSLGLLYCVKEKCLTTPFVVSSRVDLERVVKDVWPEEWCLPFGIHPLGTPRKRLPTNQLRHILSSLGDGKRTWNQLLFVAPTTAFVPSKLIASDWEAMLRELQE